MDDTIQLLQTMLNLPLLALLLARVSGLVAFAPFFGSAAIPVSARAFLAFFITVVILPVTSNFVTPPGDLGGLVIAMAGELMIGLLFGLMISTVFSGLELAGLLLGQQMGISLAQVFDPLFEEEASVLGQLYFWLTMMIFLLLRGHLIVLTALIKSFQTLPPGKLVVDQNVLDGIAGVLQLTFILGLQVSAPIIVAIFLATLALGFIGRTMPQLNILSVGFNLRVIFGFLLILVFLIPAEQAFVRVLDQAFWLLYRLLGF